MSIRVIVVEREYGSGGAMIARLLAERLQWKLWDEDLTAEIARVAQVDHRAVQNCDERVDSLLYRLFRSTLAEATSDPCPSAARPRLIQTAWSRHCRRSSNPSPRGATASSWAAAPPTFCATGRTCFPFYIYAPLDEKIRRLKAIGKSEKEALRLVEEVDRDRAAFIRHYFGKEWPTRSLYNLMINSKCGDEYVVQTILKDVSAVDSLATAEATV